MCDRQFLLNGSIFLGMLKTEAKALQLSLYLVESQTVGKRSIDVERFASNLILLVGWLAIQRAHVMESVAYLDENNAYVVAHGEQQFLKVFRLCRSLLTENTA